MDYTQSLIALIDEQGKLLEWNPAFEHWKIKLDEAVSLQEFLRESSAVLFNWMLNAGGLRQSRLQQLPRMGAADLRCQVIPLPPGGFLFCAELIQPAVDAEITRLNDELEKTRRTLNIKKVELDAVLAQADEISHTDALTFLANRRGIIADLQREVSGSDRYHTPLTIFMADIDHFKRINDTYGHPIGDQVLKEISREMLSKIRQTDKLGRYGGEEFLFLLPGTTQKSSQILAERLLKIVRSQKIETGDGATIQVTISLGIAQYRIGKESWDELLNRADKALYASKHSGRDRWTVSKNSQHPAF
jgi:diguanylate cyclase (GGDEF)-like protein